jgi:hypothetical protein
MQSLVIRAGVLTALCVFVGGAAATEATIVRGMFGPRAIGGPVAPQPRTRFDNGIQRGPSGQILGLPRNQRFYYEGPERFYYEGPERFYYDAPELRSSIPDSLPVIPARPPVASRPPVPPTAPPAVVPFRPSQPPVAQPEPPARPADSWFRTRGR